MKHFLLLFLKIPYFFWNLFPSKLRHYLIASLILLDSRGSIPSVSLQRLFKLSDFLDFLISERSMAYDSGHHPKHRLINYHHFFVERISDGHSVLDVGCGVGAVAQTVAQCRPTCTIIGIDSNPNNIAHCLQRLQLPNLSFFHGDATLSVPPGSFDVVILSNVLEHIIDRIHLLTALKIATNAHIFLIRVPLFERHWHMPLRLEIGSNFLSDPDHKIEYTLDQFKSEILASGLQISEIKTIWGEIWADCRTCV